MALTGLAGAGALAVGGIAYLGPRIQAAKTALEGMGTAGEFASRNMGRFALGLGIAGVAVAAISYIEGENAQQAAEAEAATKGFADAIRSAGDAATGIENQLETLLSETPELAELMDATGTSVEESHELRQHLRALREGAGLSRSALARKAGIPVGTLRHWEGGRGMPALPVLVRLAKALGVSVERFAEEDEPSPPEKPAEAGKARPSTPASKLSLAVAHRQSVDIVLELSLKAAEQE